MHDLRHTHATLALSAGVDIKVVSDRLGHSTSAITRDLYTHVVPAVARTAAESIAAAVPYTRRARGADVSAVLALETAGGDERGPPRRKTAGQTVSRQGDLNP
ncbi:tyrosine-type recombinase/integrase [Kineococcus arenarius]|uniref:tyrosine-type recombinase/integrase n=1 Tax=unclassified Kineococcus TaxID=2621656 RepID=UPI003D7CB642